MSAAKSATEGSIVMSGWAEQQRSPKKNLTGLTIVVGLHAIAAWAMLTSTGQQIIKIIAPVALVEVILPPPPPPPPPPPEPIIKPKLDTPPPPDTYVPPPEVAPPVTTSAPVITAVAVAPPPQQVYVPAPPAPGPPAVAGPRGFGSITNKKACTAAFQASFPREARRAGQEGSVRLGIRVGTDGKAVSVEVINSNPRRVFDRAAIGVINAGSCTFETDTAGYVAQLDITYKLSGEGDD